MKTIKYIGLDVHKNSISISTADEGRDAEVRYYGKTGNDMDQLMKVFRKFISKSFELKCAYEAGCCGYYLYRFLTGNGINCVVVAPSKIPRKTGDHLKNDKRDSITLARLHRAGELTEVYVPAEEDEALRDLLFERVAMHKMHIRKPSNNWVHFYYDTILFFRVKVNGPKLFLIGWPHCL
jgi:transposase